MFDINSLVPLPKNPKSIKSYFYIFNPSIKLNAGFFGAFKTKGSALVFDVDFLFSLDKNNFKTIAIFSNTINLCLKYSIPFFFLFPKEWRHRKWEVYNLCDLFFHIPEHMAIKRVVFKDH